MTQQKPVFPDYDGVALFYEEGAEHCIKAAEYLREKEIPFAPSLVKHLQKMRWQW